MLRELNKSFHPIAKWLTVVLAAATAGPLAAPFAPASAQEIKEGGALRAALTGEPDTLDPATSSIYTGAQVYKNIFSKLVDIDASGKFVPDLALSWTQVDPTTWKFNLADNAAFHNGEKFTSSDVKYTFERILDPKTASAYAGLYSQIASVDDTDPHVAVFHLKSPFGPFLTNLATNGEIVNRKAIEGGDPARKPVGTGPFSFVEWVQGDHITLKKNPSYFKAGLPHLDSIAFRFMPVD
jgi:peptide/nickel transport system substrate-binding protein